MRFALSSSMESSRFLSKSYAAGDSTTLRDTYVLSCHAYALEPAASMNPSVRSIGHLVSAQHVENFVLYPHLSREEIYHSVEVFYKRFYFRPTKIWEIVREMLVSWEMMKRRLQEGVEFFRFLRTRDA